MLTTSHPFPSTTEEVLDRFPRLVAHMICESLGYFTPLAAANAIVHHHEGQPFWCEWYMHMAGQGFAKTGRRPTEGEVDAALLEIGRDVIRSAFRLRRTHRGFMAEYYQARVIVERARSGAHPVLASWC